jgi:ABC-type multidrug transport system permease subunit
VADRQYSALGQMILSRIRLFVREPAAMFWVYGFPLLMLCALGAAFRDNPQDTITVDIVGGERRPELRQTLERDKRFKIETSSTTTWKKRLQYGKTDLVIDVAESGTPPGYQFWEEPKRAESRLAHYAVLAALNASDRPASNDPVVKNLDVAGSRYIDFLLPGMIGMGLMGGGMWGVGFAIVDMRVRKLLKRFLATPMRRSDFLLSIMLSRMLATVIDVVFLLGVGYFVFGVHNQGSYVAVAAACLIGSAAFAGLGLLTSSRAQTLETVSGLMNLVILPMWVLSGVFFSSEKFPEAVQPAINLLPLTALNQLLRGIMLEGNSLLTLWPQTLLLTAYGVVSFAVALKIFRWK